MESFQIRTRKQGRSRILSEDEVVGKLYNALVHEQKKPEAPEKVDPVFESILNRLDRELMKNYPDEYKDYLILVYLRDPGDIETEQLIRKYEKQFGVINVS